MRLPEALTPDRHVGDSFVRCGFGVHAERVTEVVGEATSGELSWTLSWADTDDGKLTGVLTARNVSTRPVRVSGKPGLEPLDSSGAPVGARTIVTAEFRMPGYAVIEPGKTASTHVGWAGWDGRDPSGDVRISWSGGEAIVTANGPPRPRSTGTVTNLWSSWLTAQ